MSDARRMRFLLIAVLVASTALLVATRLLMFDLTRPVWGDFKTRLFLANILVPTIVLLGVGGLAAAAGAPLLVMLGVVFAAYVVFYTLRSAVLAVLRATTA